MLSTGELDHDLGPDYYRRRDPARTTKRLIAQTRSARTHRHTPGGSLTRVFPSVVTVGRDLLPLDQTGRQLGTVAGPVVGSVTLLLKEWISPVVRLDRSP